MKQFLNIIIGTTIIAFALSACRSNGIDKKLLIGEWNFKAEKIFSAKSYNGLTILPPPSLEYNIGLIFINDSICLNKAGYVHFNRDDDVNKKSYQTFLGNKTRYVIEDSTLKIWNLENRQWDSFKIHLLTNTELQFKDNFIYQFVKVYHKPQRQHLFDQVIVSSSGCFGSCPINNVLIKNTGQVIYYGRSYNAVNGLFTANISKNEFNETEKLFNNAEFMSLKDSYDAGWTDDNTVTLIFIKNNTVVKYISDYGSQAPLDMRYAYNSALYLYQHLKLDSLHDKSFIDLLSPLDFEDKANHIIILSQSERFYLWSLLKESPLVQKSFKTKYVAKSLDSNSSKKIETDGRFFKITAKNGEVKCYDLGYDYFERNKLLHKLLDKTKWAHRYDMFNQVEVSKNSRSKTVHSLER